MHTRSVREHRRAPACKNGTRGQRIAIQKKKVTRTLENKQKYNTLEPRGLQTPTIMNRQTRVNTIPQSHAAIHILVPSTMLNVYHIMEIDSKVVHLQRHRAHRNTYEGIQSPNYDKEKKNHSHQGSNPDPRHSVHALYHCANQLLSIEHSKKTKNIKTTCLGCNITKIILNGEKISCATW